MVMRNALVLGTLALFVLVGPAPAAAQAPAPEAGALDQAKAAFKNNEFKGALEAAAQVLAQNPKNNVANYIAGTSALRLGDLEGAERYLSAAEAEAPAMAGLNYQMANLAFSRAENEGKGGNVTGAADLYRRAAEKCVKELDRKNAQGSPFSTPSLSMRAVALSRAGDVEEAVKAHEAWAAAVPGDNTPWVSLGNLYARSARGADALAILDKLPKKDAKDQEAAAYAMAQTAFTEQDFAWAERLALRGTEIDHASSRCVALCVAAYAERGLLQEAAEALTRYVSLTAPADEAEKVGRIFEKHFGTDTVPAPLPEGSKAPKVERIGDPRYPKAALKSNIQTNVLVVAQILQNGTVGSAFLVPNRILAELKTYGFEEAALETVRKGRYSPGVRGGKAADMYVAVPLEFKP